MVFLIFSVVGMVVIIDVKEKNDSELSRRPKHDRTLKKIKQLKTKARRDFRHAKKNGALVDDMQTLVKISLIWCGSRVRWSRNLGQHQCLNPSDKNRASVITLFGSM